MHLNDYQNKARKTAIYPGMQGGSLYPLTYVSLGLAEEAGEVAGHVKRIMRDDNGILTDERRHDIVMELGDTLWYLAMLADELQIQLSDVASMNLDKLAQRAEQGKLQGHGSDR